MSRASALRALLVDLGDQMTDEQRETIEAALEDAHEHQSPLHAWHCMSHEVGAVIASYDDLLELLPQHEQDRFLSGDMDLQEIVHALANAVADAPGTDDVPGEKRAAIAADPHGEPN